MIIDAIADIAEIEKAIARHGGTIRWSKPERPAAVEVRHCTVDDADASDELPASWFESEDAETDHADERDVRDFFLACAGGDRLLVQALAPRIFVEPRCQIAAERGLMPLWSVAS